jgi:hypothetical protein
MLKTSMSSADCLAQSVPVTLQTNLCPKVSPHCRDLKEINYCSRSGRDGWEGDAGLVSPLEMKARNLPMTGHQPTAFPVRPQQHKKLLLLQCGGMVIFDPGFYCLMTTIMIACRKVPGARRII